MKALAIGTGGRHVKILATGKTTHRKCPFGPTLTAKRMVAAVKKLKTLPRGCRASDNANAFIGGFRLWAQADGGRRPVKKDRLLWEQSGERLRTK